MGELLYGPEISIDIERTQSVFETAHELNLQISEQNERFATAHEIFVDEPEVLRLAEQGIAEEQQETFTNLSTIGHSEAQVYTSLGVLSLYYDSELEETQAKADAAQAEGDAKSDQFEIIKQQREQDERSKLEDILGHVERLAPKALERVKALLDERIVGTVSSQEILDLEETILDLFTEVDEHKEHIDSIARQKISLTELDRQADDTWALPQALMKVLGNDTSQWVLIDELPVDPTLSRSGHERYAELRGRHIDQPDASIYAALYLSEHDSETVTVDEIAGFLYTPETIAGISNNNLRARVTTLLGPIAGECLHKILLSEGYILQYGWRRKLEKNGSDDVKIVSRHRIYRAVPLNDLSVLETDTSSQEDYKDDFEVTPEIVGLFTDFKQERAAKPPEAVIASNPDSAIRLPAHRDGTRLRTPAKPEEELPRWVKEFEKEVMDILEELEMSDMLTSEEGELIKVARHKSRSRSFATEETLTKLYNAGHMRQLSGIPRPRWGDVKITAPDMIIMKMFTTKRELLGKGQPRRPVAESIIEGVVADYFTHKREINPR